MEQTLFDYDILQGVLISIWLLMLVVAPIYCCQIDNDEYSKIHERYLQAKIKTHAEKVFSELGK